VIVAKKPFNVIPVALLATDAGPLPIWIDSGQSIDATPLCSGDGGAAGAAGAGGAP